jgi:hypothetical protein
MNHGAVNRGGIIGVGEPSIVGNTDVKGWPTRPNLQSFDLFLTRLHLLRLRLSSNSDNLGDL